VILAKVSQCEVRMGLIQRRSTTRESKIMRDMVRMKSAMEWADSASFGVLCIILFEIRDPLSLSESWTSRLPVQVYQSRSFMISQTSQKCLGNPIVTMLFCHGLGVYEASTVELKDLKIIRHSGRWQVFFALRRPSPSN
jgi:hypothetical protein